MQKKLLTLAVAGALAAPGLALAQVEVYGFVNMSFGNFKYGEPTQAGVLTGVSSVSKWDVASHASNYGIRGRENVGGGNSDLVLCGGADVHNGLNDFLLFSSVHALSPTGRPPPTKMRP